MVRSALLEKHRCSDKLTISQRAIGIAKALVASPHPVRFAVSRILRATGLCWLIYIQRDGYRLHFFPTAFSASLWAESSRSSQDDRFLRSFLRPGDVVVDVGANIGTHSIMSALCVGTAGRVYACEAHPRIVEFLRQNIDLNGLTPSIQVLHCAVGESRGDAIFSDERSDDQNRIVGGDGNGIRVSVDTLDSLVLEPRIDLLKIDVEGFELMVLRGASKTLSRTRAIYFEAWNRHYARYGYSFAELWGFLSSAGFTVMNSRTQEPIARSEEIEECVNLLALRPEVCA